VSIGAHLSTSSAGTIFTATLLSVARSGFYLVLFSGVLIGLGRLALFPLVRRPLPAYWYYPIAAIAGLNVAYLSVQTAAIAQHSRRFDLQVIGAALCVIAAIAWALVPAGAEPVRTGTGALRSVPRVLIAIALLGLCSLVVIASAPSTKFDELYYHMLVPKRIMQDGGIRPYLLPYEASALPHMQLQIGLSILHAWGDPDAGNFVSVVLGVLLAAFLFGFCLEETGSVSASALVASTACAAMYAAVHFTTSGPHSLGDLATTLACAALLKVEALTQRLGPFRAVFLISLCAATAAATKVSLWPVAAAITVLFGVCVCLRGGRGYRIALAAVCAWIVCQGPMMAFTWHATAAPFGPFFLGSFFGAGPPHAYAEVIANSRAADQAGFARMLVELAASVSPIVPLSVLLLACPAGKKRKIRLAIGALLVLQIVLIYLFLPHTLRFATGLLFAAVAAASTVIAGSRTCKWIEEHAAVLGIALLGPWLAVQLYYTAEFSKVFAGFTTRAEFIEKFAALTADFRALDRLLPASAVILTDDRLPSFYSPRPVIFAPEDYRFEGPLYVLATGEEEPRPFILRDGRAAGCTVEVYRNPSAVIVTYRTPGRSSIRGPVSVYRCAVAGRASSGLPVRTSMQDVAPY
jgi:hypothetical protein